VDEADSAARHIQDRVRAYQQKAETRGLTRLQAQYVAINAVGGSTYPQRDRVLDDLRDRVGAEATSAGLDAKQIVARLDAIATAPDDGGAELRLKDLGRTDELARLTEGTIPKGGSLDDALRRRAGP
jgi:hypothetical protein